MKDDLLDLYKTFKERYKDGESFKITFSYEELPDVEFELHMEEKFSDKKDMKND